MRIRRFWLVMLGIVVLMGSADPCWAGWKEQVEANKLVQEATKHEKQEAWQEARDAYAAAIELHDSPRARKGLAKALYQLGLLIEAREHAQVVADNKRAGWWDRKHSKELLEKIEAELPHITVSVPPAFEGTVRVDDKPWPSDKLGTRTEINPGTVVITAESDGFLPYEKTVVLDKGADEKVNIELEPKPKPKPKKDDVDVSTSDGSTRKTIGYVSLAIGGAGLIAGTAFGLSARNTRNELDSACLNDVCSEAQRDNYDRGKMQANFSTAGFIVGGVGLGLGAVLLLTGPKDQETEATKARVEPYVGPTGAGFSGVF